MRRYRETTPSLNLLPPQGSLVSYGLNFPNHNSGQTCFLIIHHSVASHLSLTADMQNETRQVVRELAAAVAQVNSKVA